jgi:predicted ATPase/class 3 adenylate cyclase
MSATEALDIRLLGGFHVAVGDHGLPDDAWRRERVAALVKLLALAPDHRLRSDDVRSALWSDHQPGADDGMRGTLHQARQQLEKAGAAPGVFLASDGEWVVLGPPGLVFVDVDAFAAAAADAWRHHDPAATEAALALYGGDLLPSDADQKSVAERRSVLRASFLALLRRLAELAEERGELDRALAADERLLTAEPADEPALRMAMRLEARAGQPSRALIRYEGLIERMARDGRAAPSPETQELAAAIRAGRFPAGSGSTPSLPSGMVTFLFTDIEGSTARWERDAEAMAVAIPRHDALLNSAVEEHGGRVFKSLGDGICAVFPDAVAAVTAAVEAQRVLTIQDWGDLGPLRVRMALHSGAAVARGGDYAGPPLNRAARLLSAGHGGQILLSHTTEELVRGNAWLSIMLRDLGEHRLRDLPEPERVFHVVAPDLPAEFPPLRSIEGPGHGLPAPPDALIGREREIAEVRQLLATGRLVTLTGPGGMGKTRLALAVGHELMPAFPDGVAFVDLSSLRDPSLVVPTIAAALGVAESGERPLRDEMIAAIASKELLLILDNFEQVLDAASVVAELLAACPHLKILATSRAPLRLRGEQDYPLQPLALPDLANLPPPAALSRYGAVSLFIERARAVRPTFIVTEETAPALAAICRALDGLPLAIELAAARVRLLPLPALLARLDQPLAFLADGARDLPARHQTLRATIAWSHDLLRPEEQVIFRRLAVCVGGCTLEAAERLAAAGDGLLADRSATTGQWPTATSQQPAFDLFADIEALVDQSLLRDDQRTTAEPRVAMLETIREFALERLESSGEAAAARRAHAEFFLGLAEQAEPQLTGADQALWLDRLETEHGNLRAALAELERTGEGVAFVRLAGALWRFWWLRGHLSEGRRWLEQALAGGGDAGAADRARALDGTGALAEAQGDVEVAQGLHEEALALRRALGDRLGCARSLENLGIIELHDRGNRERARAHFAESLALFQALDHRLGIANALGNLGDVALVDESYDQAAVQYADALAVARELGDPRAVAGGLTNLGRLAFHQGRFARAAALYEETLPLWRELGDLQSLAVTLGNLGEAVHHQGDFSRAEALYEEALPLCQELGDKQGLAFLLSHLGRLAHERGDDRRAAALFVEGIGLCRQVGDLPRLAECLDGLSAATATRVGPARAARLFGAAEALREEADFPVPAVLRAAYDADVAKVRAALDQGTFAAAWASGRDLSLEDALAEAVEIGEESAGRSIASTGFDERPTKSHSRRADSVATGANSTLTP